MKKDPTPNNEKQRLEKLRELKILDTPQEEIFDELTQLAANICGTKMAIICLVDEGRLWFKSKYGVGVPEIPRDSSFYGLGILHDSLFVLEDISKSEEFFDTPFYIGTTKILFYAGAPLITRQGYNVGTLCVLDKEVRSLTDYQKKSLEILAKQIVFIMESKITQTHMSEIQEQLERAQEIAQVGSWEFNLVNNEQIWSKEHYKIFEIPMDQDKDELYTLYRQKIHPEDLQQLDYYINRAIQKGEDFIYNHRVFLESGKKIKYVQGIGKIIKDSFGRPIRITGTCRDMTPTRESELKYENILKTMSDGLVVQDESGKIVECNAAALKILGLTENELLHRTSFDPKWKAIREDGSDFPGNEHPAIVSLRENRNIENIVMGLEWPNGDIHWIKINASLQNLMGGKRVYCSFTDITSQLRNAKDIEKYFHLSLNLLCMANVKGQFLRVNTEFERLLGHRREDLEGASFLSFIHPEDMPDTLKAIERLKSGATVINFVNRYRCKNGEYRYLEWMTSPDPKTGILYASAKDVTLEKEKQFVDEIKLKIQQLYISSKENKTAFWEKILDLLISITKGNSCFIAGKTNILYKVLVHRNILPNIFPYLEKEFSELDMVNVEENLKIPLTYAQECVGYLGIPDSQISFGKWKEILDCLGEILHASILETNLEKTQIIKSYYQFALDKTSIIEFSDISGKIRYANEFFCKSAEYSMQEIIGKDYRIINSGMMSKEFFKNLWDTIKSGKVWEGEICNRSKSQRLYWVYTTIVPMLDKLGHVEQFMAIRRDITKEKTQQLQLIEAYENAQAGTKAKTDFLYMIGHEIRTPLNGIIGMAELVQKSGLNPQQQEYVDTIANSGKSLLVLINDVLDFSKIEAGKLELSEIEFDPTKVIEDFSRPFYYSAQKKNLSFHLKNPPYDSYLLGDEGKMGQIIANLVSNAIKFTHEGEVSLSIQYEKEGDSTLMRIVVKDTGIGIPKKEQSQLFESFFQASKTISRNYGGTGLGLSISKRLAQMMKGDIDFESIQGQGSKFIVSLRFKTARLKTALIPRESKMELISSPVSSKKYKILVAEDNKTNQLVISRMLEYLGYSFILAENGEEVLSLLLENPIDLILMDCRMPILDGYEASQKIRANFPQYASLPIVALTANAVEGDEQKCYEAGMNDYLTKPIEIKKLSYALEKNLGLKRPNPIKNS